jgi:hypothetical protein
MRAHLRQRVAYCKPGSSKILLLGLEKKWDSAKNLNRRGIVAKLATSRRRVSSMFARVRYGEQNVTFSERPGSYNVNVFEQDCRPAFLIRFAIISPV